MAETKTVGIKELKNKLSAYLREARAGVRILISDRDAIVAELHEPCWDRTPGMSGNPPLSDWVKAGAVRLPTAEKRQLRASPVRMGEGTSLRLLDEERGDPHT